MWRWICRPLAGRAGTRAAVGCVWQTQVTCRGISLLTAARTVMAVSKPFSCRDGLPTSRTDRTPAVGLSPCYSQPALVIW